MLCVLLIKITPGVEVSTVTSPLLSVLLSRTTGDVDVEVSTTTWPLLCVLLIKTTPGVEVSTVTSPLLSVLL